MDLRKRVGMKNITKSFKIGYICVWCHIVISKNREKSFCESLHPGIPVGLRTNAPRSLGSQLVGNPEPLLPDFLKML